MSSIMRTPSELRSGDLVTLDRECVQIHRVVQLPRGAIVIGCDQGGNERRKFLRGLIETAELADPADDGPYGRIV